MNYSQAMERLRSCGQEHVLAGWSRLDAKARRGLLAQVEQIDPASVRRCQAALKAGGAAADSSKGVADLRALSLQYLSKHSRSEALS